MSQNNLNVTENITQKHNVTNNNYISQIGAACYNSMLYQPKSKYIPDIDVERLQLHQNKSTACYIQKDLFMLPKDFHLVAKRLVHAAERLLLVSLLPKKTRKLH
jgi:hypothetical protein